MSSLVLIVVGFFLVWLLILLVIITTMVRSRKLKLKKGGAPGTGSGSHWLP